MTPRNSDLLVTTNEKKIFFNMVQRFSSEIMIVATFKYNYKIKINRVE